MVLMTLTDAEESLSLQENALKITLTILSKLF